MQTVVKQLSELHKTDKNIRRHPERQMKEYIRSLEMFGQVRPLVVTEDGEVLIGNGLYDALTAMGKEECDVYVVTGLTQAEKRKLMLADNKVYEMGFTDIGILDDILNDLNGDFNVPGYDIDLLNTLVASPAEATKEIENYGTFQPTTAPAKTDNVLTHQDTPVSPYAPPVRTDDGDFAPPSEIPSDKVISDESRNYILCPHCGEKIWL